MPELRAEMATPVTVPAAKTYAELVADALLVQPELLHRAQATCQRWRALQAEPTRWLDQWDVLLSDAMHSTAGMARLQDVLRSADAESERLREFAPIAGLLPRDVRRTARESCGFRH